MSRLDVTGQHDAQRTLAAERAALTHVVKVAESCATAMPIAECLERILDAAIAVTTADKGNIQLYDEASGTLKIAVHRGFAPAFLDFFDTVEPGEAAACGAALEAATRVVVDDVTTSPIFAGQPSLDVLRDAG